MTNKYINIALVLSTDGLEYDDRIRKEILSIQKLYPNIKFKIFAVVPDNRSESGITSYGTPYEILKLETRDKLKSGSHLLRKSWDFYQTVKPKLKGFDYVWCADVHTFLIVAFCKQPVLWDLHELPLVFAKTKFMKVAFNAIAKKCKVIVHANNERIDYLESIGLCKDRKKHFALRNYPSFSEHANYQDDLLDKFVLWQDNKPCVYLQGCDGDRRAALESVTAVLNTPELKAVVIGNFPNDIKESLHLKYGDEFSKRIFFTGMVKQVLTPSFISKCIFTLVFYKNISPNNWYCEANRLYQNIVNGNPVICGANPPMKELVERYGFGLATKTDGSDVREITEAIQTMMNNSSTYKNNIEKNKHLLQWESQEDIIKTFMDKFLK